MRGRCIVLSASSGGGKGTIKKELLKFDPSLVIITTFTTRSPREGEVNGREYHFISYEEFSDMTKQGLFLEVNEYVGHMYGTTRDSVVSELQKGKIVLLEIDCNGARNVKAELGYFVKSIFLKVPIEILNHRLRERGKDSPEAIQKRLMVAQEEMNQLSEFDFVINNDHHVPEQTAREILRYINDVRGLALV